MKTWVSCVAAAALVLLGAAGASAGAIVVSTGLDGSGNLQSAGNSVDANWTYVDANFSPTSGNTYVVASNNTDWFGGWLANGPNSDWISPDPDVSGYGTYPYSFSTTFGLSDYDLSTVSLSGAWAIDDQGSLFLNGNLISSIGDGNWGSLTAFSVPVNSPDFNQGLNTLTITMTWTDDYLEGVRLEGSVTGDVQSTPEPGSWALAGLGALAIGAIGRRRRA